VPKLPVEFELMLRKNGLSLDQSKGELLGSYVEMLLEWNRKINLISRRDVKNIWQGHLLHCLSPLFMLDIPDGTMVLDLGTGGGLPGIPLAIVHGGLKMTLLDSIRKKTAAVEAIVKALDLGSIRVVTARAEEAGSSKEMKGSYDFVVARAVAPLTELVRWSRPFLRKREITPVHRRVLVGGVKNEFSFPYLLALKGGDLEAEKRQAAIKAKASTITEINLVFQGSELLDFVDKKLIIVEFP